jgi:two-component system, cell cycle sensor histidine kinase and response regulator CckA
MVVLVVDDNETVLAVVAPILRRSGYHVLQAKNLAGALRIISRPRLKIDLVVTDIQMPDGTGFDLSDELHELRPHTPVVFMSGGYRPNDPDLRARLGPRRAFLPKPFTLSTLLARVVEITSAPIERLAMATF